MSTKNWAETTSYTDYTEKKANLASQVQEKTSVAFAFHDEYSGFILFSGGYLLILLQ